MKDIVDITGVSVVSAGLSDAKVSMYVKVAIAFGLQAIADAMRETWGYLAAFDCATYHSTSYMDIRLRFFWKDAIVNLHLLALPMFERHSGEYIFDLFNRLLSVLDPAWRQTIVGVTTDGAANMTGSNCGAVSRIERETFQGFYRAWCGLHQLDIVVQRAVSKLYDDKFYGRLTALIGYLRRKQIFTQEMASKCPKVATTLWLSLGKVSARLVTKICAITEYLQEKYPCCQPGSAWWVLL
jgi:hypothetical protein